MRLQWTAPCGMSDNALDAVNGSEDTGISSSFDLFQSRPTSGNSDVVVEIPSGSATPRPNTRHSVFITEATVITSDATQPEIEDHLLASRDSSHRPNLIKRLQSFRPQDDFYKRIGEIQSETSSRPVSPDQKAFDNPVDVLFGFIEQTSEALLECLARESKDAQSSLDLLLDGTNRPVDFSSRVNALTTTFDGAFRAIKKLILDKKIAIQSRHDLSLLLKDRDAQIKRLEAELAIEDRVPEASPNTTTSFFDEQEIYQQVLRDCQYENASAALARPQRDRVSSRTNQFSDGFVFNPEPNSEGHIRSFSANSKVSHIPRQSKKINGIVRIPGTDVVQKMNDNISGPFPRKENNSQASIVSARSDISFRAGSADSGMSEQQPTLQKQSDSIEYFKNVTRKELVQISGEMLSIQKLFDRPSTLGVGMGAMSAFDIETSPKERAIHSRPSAFPVTPYHTNRVRDVSVKAVLQDRSNATSVPVTTNTRDTIVLLHEKLKYVTSGFHECIDALAEEHRQTRIWKGEYEKLDRQVQSQAQESRMIEAKNKRFLNKRQGLVNALLPIARPILADHDKWIEEAKKPAAVYVFNNPVKSSDEVNLKHAKREISGKVRVYIPSISTSLYAAKSNVPHFNIAGPKSKIRKQFFGDEKPKSFLNVRKLVAEKL